MSIDDYIIASNSTLISPPKEIPEFTVPCFNKDKQKWELKPDYRPKSINGNLKGGKPFYNSKEYWWAREHWMTTIGDKPEGTSWSKMEIPQIVKDVVNLRRNILEWKTYLSNTDYIHNVIAEVPEAADKYAPIIEEREKVRLLIDPAQEQIDSLKEQIVSQYGEEALNHLG